MWIKSVPVLSILLFANGAQAIEMTRCPYSFAVTVKVDRVYQSSTYDMVPGWFEAQESLQKVKQIRTHYKLAQPDPSACSYDGDDGSQASLATAKSRDSEENESVVVDQLSLRYKFEDSAFVSYVPIKDYSKTGLVAPNRPQSVKIKARLYYPQTKKTSSFDIGTITVSFD